MTENAPEVVNRYLKAADEKDPAGAAACFTEDGTVTDEGVLYAGRDAIAGWRASTIAQWTYTSVVTGSEPAGADEYRVTAHVEGNFPGGQADLTYRFSLHNGLIRALLIG